MHFWLITYKNALRISLLAQKVGRGNKTLWEMLLCSLELSYFKSKVDSDKLKCIW